MGVQSIISIKRKQFIAVAFGVVLAGQFIFLSPRASADACQAVSTGGATLVDAATWGCGSARIYFATGTVWAAYSIDDKLSDNQCVYLHAQRSNGTWMQVSSSCGTPNTAQRVIGFSPQRLRLFRGVGTGGNYLTLWTGV